MIITMKVPARIVASIQGRKVVLAEFMGSFLLKGMGVYASIHQLLMKSDAVIEFNKSLD